MFIIILYSNAYTLLIYRMELRVGNKYRLGRKIGSGSFGDIYLGKCLCVAWVSVCVLRG